MIECEVQFSVLIVGLYYQFLSNHTICHNLLKWLTVNDGKSHKFITFSQPTIVDHIQIVLKVDFLLISEVSVCVKEKWAQVRPKHCPKFEAHI